MIAIYVRQSIEKRDSISIENQIEKCMTEIKDSDTFKIYKDKGFSGKNTNRPAFKELIKDVKYRKINKIVVYRLDRFSRSIADFGSIWQILAKFNVEFISINEKFDTSSPIGVAMLNIIMVFAQLERETISERIKDNYYMRAKIGGWLGGPAPYGFDIEKVNISGKKTSKLIPNKNIHTVKKIFNEYSLETTSLGEIAKKLSSENIPCISKKNWDSVAVSRILHNPIYVKSTPEIYLYLEQKGISIENDINEFDGKKAGMIIGKNSSSKYNNISGQKFTLALHNGVIDANIWLKCQNKLYINSQVKNTGKGKYTWLSGLFKCGNCGYSLKIVSSKGKRYFVCSGKTNYHICDKSYSHADLSEIEYEIKSKVNKIFKDNLIEFDKNEIFKDNQINFSKEIINIDEKINRLLSAVSEGSSISIKYLNREIERLEICKQKLLEKINDKKEKSPKKTILQLNFENCCFEEKKKIIKELIEKIIIQENHVKIIWKI